MNNKRQGMQQENNLLLDVFLLRDELKIDAPASPIRGRRREETRSCFALARRESEPQCCKSDWFCPNRRCNGRWTTFHYPNAEPRQCQPQELWKHVQANLEKKIVILFPMVTLSKPSTAGNQSLSFADRDASTKASYDLRAAWMFPMSAKTSLAPT